MKQITGLLMGLVLTGLGIFLLLDSIQISSFGFYAFYGVNSAPILLILFAVFVILAVVVSSWWTWVLMVLDLIGIVVSVIMGTHFYFKHMTALTLVIMIAVLAVGLGLTIRNLFKKPENAK